MKKLIVLLLAFALVGAVSAQVTTAVSLSGQVRLIDEALKSTFNDNGTVTLQASDKDGKYGFSISDYNVIADGFDSVGDWNVWYNNSWGKMIFGNLSNGDFTLALPVGYTTQFENTEYVEGYGLLYETPTVKNLTFGVNLPVPTAGEKTVDMLRTSNVAAIYSDKNVTWVALADLDFVTPNNIVDFGLKYTGFPALTVVGLVEGQFDKANYLLAGGLAYKGIDKVTLNVEASYQTKGGYYDAWGQVAYAVTSAVTAKAGGYYGFFKGKSTATPPVADATKYDIYGSLAYSFGNGLSLSGLAGYNQKGFHGNANINYGVSF